MRSESLGYPKVGLPCDMPSARHGNDLHLGILLAHLGDEFEPVTLGHEQIRDHNVDRPGRHDLGRLDSILGGHHRMPVAFEHDAKKLPYSGLVIYDKYRTGGHYFAMIGSGWYSSDDNPGKTMGPRCHPQSN